MHCKVNVTAEDEMLRCFNLMMRRVLKKPRLGTEKSFWHLKHFLRILVSVSKIGYSYQTFVRSPQFFTIVKFPFLLSEIR